MPLPDLINEGAMGLMRAAESFDPSRGLKFISYSVWWIKAYITRAINEKGSLIRLPANRHLEVRKAIKESIRTNKALDDEIKELIYLGEKGNSIDAPLKDDSQITFSEILADEITERPDMKTEASLVEDFTRELLAELPEREAKILKGLYGIDSEVTQSLREMAENLDLSHERVRQLREQALWRLRKGRFKNILKEKLYGYAEAVR